MTRFRKNEPSIRTRHTLAVMIAGLLMWGGLIGCAGENASPLPRPRIFAVWTFADYSAQENVGMDMADMITARFIQTLQDTPGIIVVEREKLDMALAELNMGSSALADDAARLSIGRTLGATHMVFGGYQVIGNMMRMDIRLVETTTGKIIKSMEKTVSGTDISLWLDAAKQAALAIATLP